MSFGFSVGDFIAAIELANRIRREFVDAPSQFKAVLDEVRSLSIVLQDADIAFSKQELSNDQKRDLEDIDKGCRNVLDELQRIVDRDSELISESKSVGKRIKRVWKRLNWKPEDIDKLRSRLSANISFLNAFNGRITRDSIVKLVRHQENQEWKTILDWLTPIDYAAEQHDFISRRQEGTGQWLLDSPEFQLWLKTNRQTLYCPGIPGSGKTIVAATVVEELTTRFHDDKSIGIAYLYCNFRRQDEQKINDLLANLLKQLAGWQPSLPSSVKDLYDRHKKQRTRPSVDEISRSLQSLIATYTRVFIIIDALDECQESHGCRSAFLSEIFNLQDKSGANLFATSRSIPEITGKFQGSISLEIRANEYDVRRYLDSQIFRLPSFVQRSLDLQEEVKTEIIKVIDGMFLLAKLHLDSLVGKRSSKAVRAALQKLPSGSDAYDNAYKDAMIRIEGQVADQKELAKQVLLWITCANRPLNIVELQYALAVEVGESELDKENLPDIEDMVSVCAGLVTVDEESSIIRLVHYTTQEYFNRTQKLFFPNAEAEITINCTTYLLFNVFERGFCQTDDEFEERLRLNQFFEYAAKNWGHHARKASILSRASSQAVVDFLKSEAKVEASGQVLLAVKRYSFITEYSQEVPRIKGLHLAAYFGLEEAIITLLENEDNFDSKDSNGQTPLLWATSNGHEAVTKLLLEKGAELEIKDIKYGRTPLLYATVNRHKAVVKLLLEKGAELETKNIYGQTPLLLAALEGHEAIVKILLEKGAELETKDRYDLTPLSHAAANGHKAVVKLLLEKGIELDFKDGNDRTPLLWATAGSHEAIVKLLLEKGAELEVKSRNGETPLLWATRNGCEAVVKLLLEKGADLEPKNKYGQTPLSCAAEEGHKAMVKLLLEKGTELETKDSSGWTPLLHAAANGHKAVVKLLLMKGAKLETKDSNGWTPLLWAALEGYETVVGLLLEKGAKLETKDINRRTPLSWAAQNGHGAVVDLLLEKGAELETKDSKSRTPLSYAAEKGYKEVVTLLLEKGAELETKNSNGWTPLIICCNE